MPIEGVFESRRSWIRKRLFVSDSRDFGLLHYNRKPDWYKLWKSVISMDLSQFSNSFVHKTTPWFSSVKVWIDAAILLYDICFIEHPIFFLFDWSFDEPNLLKTTGYCCYCVDSQTDSSRKVTTWFLPTRSLLTFSSKVCFFFVKMTSFLSLWQKILQSDCVFCCFSL